MPVLRDCLCKTFGCRFVPVNELNNIHSESGEGSKELYIPSEETAWFPSPKWATFSRLERPSRSTSSMFQWNKRRLAVAHVEERPAWKDKPMDTHGWSFVTFDHLFRGAIILIQSRSNPYAFEEIKQAWSNRSKELFSSLLRCQHKTLQEGVFAALQHAICTGHWLLADVSSVARLKSRWSLHWPHFSWQAQAMVVPSTGFSVVQPKIRNGSIFRFFSISCLLPKLCNVG